MSDAGTTAASHPLPNCHYSIIHQGFIVHQINNPSGLIEYIDLVTSKEIVFLLYKILSRWKRESGFTH
jgi:hypothetical protein